MTEMIINGLEDIEIQNTPIDEIDNENVNLMFLGIDESGSMDTFRSDMKKSLIDFKDALLNSKEVDEILVARANFYNNKTDIGGYKKIEDFDTDYETYGQTPLYDVIIEGTEKLTQYMDYLKQQGMRVKAVFAIFSDGDDTSSAASLNEAKAKIKELNDREIVTAFISFGGQADSEAKRLGFKNILSVGASASELRKAFNCLSKSVKENSKSVTNNTDDFFQM